MIDPPGCTAWQHLWRLRVSSRRGVEIDEVHSSCRADYVMARWEWDTRRELLHRAAGSRLHVEVLLLCAYWEPDRAMSYGEVYHGVRLPPASRCRRSVRGRRLP